MRRSRCCGDRVVQVQMIGMNNFMMMMMVLLVVLSSKESELLKDEVELGAVVLDLGLKLQDVAVTTADGVVGAHVGLVDDGSHGLVLVVRVELFDDFGDVSDAEQFMGVEELALAIVRKIRCENAVSSAFPALVLTSSASLVVVVVVGGGVVGGVGVSRDVHGNWEG